MCILSPTLFHICSKCSYKETQLIGTVEHTEETRRIVNATCTTPGYSGDVFCSECDELLELGYVTPATGHTIPEDYEVIDEPSCTESGEIRYVCTVCNIEIEEAVPALGHSFDSYETISEADCIEDGLTKGYCTRCNSEVTQVVPALGHLFGDWETTLLPTCCCTGTKSHVCSRCTEIESVTLEKDPLNHSGGTMLTNAVDATCSEYGNTGNLCCSGCNTILSYGSQIPKDTGNHTGATFKSGYIAATCTAAGNEDNTYCGGCNTLLEKGAVIPATGHKYVYSEIQNNADMHRVTCQNCSIAMYSSHDYVLEKHTDSTYTEKGTDEYNCSLCNHKKTVLLGVIPDITPPTAEIDVSEKKSWQSFVETITFGVFCNGSDKIKICAEDDESGIAKIYYFISETPISEDALKEYELSEWTEYDKSFWFESEGNFIVYALLINNQGGQAIISSDGLVVDLTNPIITGVEEGKTYCVSASFTVIDSNIESILINDVALDTLSGEHTVSTSGENIIVATDKAGNTTTLRFFMENSHIYDEYESIDSEYHASKCDCGDEKIEKHSFGTWIQTKPSTTSERGEGKRVCMQCGYTEFKLLDLLVATKIEIANKPNTQYRYKQDFDIAGLTLTATYSDGSTKTITDTSKMTVTGYDKKKTGTQELTVKYENCEAKLAVTVKLTWWQWLIKIILFGWLWY